MAWINTGLISHVSWVSPLHSSMWKERKQDKRCSYKGRALIPQPTSEKNVCLCSNYAPLDVAKRFSPWQPCWQETHYSTKNIFQSYFSMSFYQEVSLLVLQSIQTMSSQWPILQTVEKMGQRTSFLSLYWRLEIQVDVFFIHCAVIFCHTLTN